MGRSCSREIMSILRAINTLKEKLPSDSWTEDQNIIAPHLIEWRDRWQGVTPFLVQPKTTLEVVKIVNICQEFKASLCLQGGNTGLVGGQIPQGEILLSTKRLKAIRSQSNQTLTVESGLSLTQVHELAEKINKKFPITLASEGSANIGGLCSTNAGGMHVVRYGSMRNLVAGIEVVLSDGSIINTLDGLKKDNSGYELTPLFIGAEGTLGIITAATLKIYAQAKETQTLFVALNSPKQATEFYFKLKERFANELSVIELIPKLAINWVEQSFKNTVNPFQENYPWCVLAEFNFYSERQKELEKSIEQALQSNLILDAVLAQSNTQAKQLRAIRENISAAQKNIGHSIKHDVSVPIGKVAEFINKASKAVTEFIPGCRPLPFGHVGDGNIHFNVMQPINMQMDEYLTHWESMNRIVHDIVCGLGGSISAEHGIGILKKRELQERYPKKLIQMRRLKQAFDPDNLFNPRVLFE